MNDLQRILTAFDQLKCAKSIKLGEAPHKPILLLAIIAMTGDGVLKSRQINLTPELERYFKLAWLENVRTDYVMNLASPFYHMKSEPFWAIRVRTGYEEAFTNKYKMKALNSLKQAVEYAEIDSALWALLQSAVTRQQLQDFLLTRYFNKTEPLAPDFTEYKAVLCRMNSDRDAANDADKPILLVA